MLRNLALGVAVALLLAAAITPAPASANYGVGMVAPSMPPPTRFSPIHAPSALPMRSADGTGAIPTILIGTLVCPTIGAGDPVPAGARAANII
jgi:hypothetical protein